MRYWKVLIGLPTVRCLNLWIQRALVQYGPLNPKPYTLNRANFGAHSVGFRPQVNEYLSKLGERRCCQSGLGFVGLPKES